MLPPPQPLEGLIDSHCHVPPHAAEAVLGRARAAGLRGFVVVGVGETSAEARGAIALAEAHPDVVAAIGIHPHDARTCDDATMAELATLAAHPRVAAVGEIGLDFHYDHSPRDQQRAAFRRQIGLARALRKPLVIHTRAAGQETLDVLEQERASDVGGIIHCFSEDAPFARRALDLGFDLSFSGIVTFKAAAAVQEVARLVPRDRYLVETDAPYLAPVPLRGKPCEPAFVVYTARHLATLRGVAPEQIAAESAANTRRWFPGLA